MAAVMTTDLADIAVDHQRMVHRMITIMRTSIDPLTLDDLAEIAGLSPFYFARTFRSVIGIPPGEFQTALRFERAKRLLLTSTASVTEICFEVDYDSLGTFSSRFKRLIGIGPAQFRELPHLIAGMDIRAAINRDFTATGSSTSVEGTIQAPHGLRSHVYVGLFTAAIAASRPIVGQVLPEPGAFALPQVPPGTYVVLAAALPDEGTPLDYLLPGSNILVAGSEPVVVRNPNERHRRSLVMRPLRPTDPPLLIALPALLL
jgi:AraC family transcriptional regulator